MSNISVRHARLVSFGWGLVAAMTAVIAADSLTAIGEQERVRFPIRMVVMVGNMSGFLLVGYGIVSRFRARSEPG